MKYLALGMNNALHKNQLHPMVAYSDLQIHNPYRLLEKTMRMKIKLIVKY